MERCGYRFISDLLSLKTASYGALHLIVEIAVAKALTLDWRKAENVALTASSA
jgi:uncharacterized membrane protein